MPNYVVFNTISNDGVGDFYHFEGIIKKLLADHHYKNVQFFAIVGFQTGGRLSKKDIKKIEQELKQLNVQFLYGSIKEHEAYSLNENVQKQLSTADQAIIISCDKISKFYQPFFNKNGMPIKYIMEHEYLTPSLRDNKPLLYRSLGLSKNHTGIKIEDIPLIQPDAAWEIMMRDNAVFCNQLLEKTASANFKALHAKNIFVPAYFSHSNGFTSFMDFIGSNDSVSGGKNIIMLVSGVGCKPDIDILSSLLKTSPVKKIELMILDQDSKIDSDSYEANPKGTKTIIIMSGFYLETPSYNAFFQLAREGIAGVSGDNSFENCISMGVFPFYWSTNASDKLPTLRALQEITQRPELAISKEARESYQLYFEVDKMVAHVNHSTLSPSAGYFTKPSPYLNVNAQEMRKYWPAITTYLREGKQEVTAVPTNPRFAADPQDVVVETAAKAEEKHYNFYNFYKNLPHILCESLPLEAQPAFV